MNRELSFNEKSPEIIYLISKDPRLGKVISYLGDYKLRLRTDYFSSLSKSIIGQQLSVKAANTIWGRFVDNNKRISPEIILNTDDETFRHIGISRPKIKFLKNLSYAMEQKLINLDNLNELNNQEIIESLSTVKGIGKWTAEMFLIFSLGRLDVFSIGDVGLKRSMIWLYEEFDEDMYFEVSDNWKPFRTVASIYLWEIINTGLITKYSSFNDFILDM